MAAQSSAGLRVSKKTLSMYLRTRCDKELFLSLHDPKLMVASGLPEPIKRPGIGILAVEGKQFEADRNDLLVQLFPSLVQATKKGNQYADRSLEADLLAMRAVPGLILQGRFSIGSTHVASVLKQIGVTAAAIPLIPTLADFIPDVIYARRPYSGDAEVRPDGSRASINHATEQRFALSIIDIKHTGEANPSYCSEIAMYALMLSNWLALRPALHDRYFVSSSAFLWTRAKQGDSQLARLQGQASTDQELLDALIADSEDAQLRFYLSSIRDFFENVARVIREVSINTHGWEDLDWHVASSCASCDWIGDKRHMGQQARAKVDANPTNYCMPLAQYKGHLSLIPGVTRGAKKVLCQNAVSDAPSLAAATGHQALQQHTLLKREAKTLPARSSAVTTGTLTLEKDAAIASMVPSAHLLLYASVNFDSSSGLMTGLAISGIATDFKPKKVPRRFPSVPFVVDQKTLAAEWVALEGFLTEIAKCVDVADQLVPSPTGQIHFWEQRQLRELCHAMGRHLPRVLALSERKAKALAWIFSPDEMVAKPESLEAATVVAIDDIVRRLVFAPTRHVITLFDTVEHYGAGGPTAERDAYYREYLTNGVPRERIYEIWSNAPQVKRGAATIPRNTIIAQYSRTLEKQCRSLESVCERLRRDYRQHFRARATHIPLSIPQGARGVAFDSKLWLWWDKLDFNASQLEAHDRLSMDGERLEATYEAIILRNGKQMGSAEYEFDVAPGSVEAKFKEDTRLTIGKLGYPGMPLQRISTIVDGASYTGNEETLMRPLWSALDAKLLAFDRRNRRARVRLECRDEPQLVPFLLSSARISLLDEIFLVETKKPSYFSWAEQAEKIFSAIGNPRIATPDPNAARAMGINPSPALRRGPHAAETPAARVLWAPEDLEQRVVVPTATAAAFAAQVRDQDRLNPSQTAAVAHAIERSLTVIWGPPGTGKTNTLAAMLHAMTRHAISQGQHLSVLVTGPTYKAVEETLSRALIFIGADAAASCTVFMGYSQGRIPAPPPPALAAHIQYRQMVMASANPDFQNCLRQLQNGPGVVIVGCQIRQARQFAKMIGDEALHEVFDVVVIDESSQVPVSHAASALSGLKADARLVIAGDHLQMPPITSIESPAEATYMVGSIQTYLKQRSFAQPVVDCVLERNYRSHEHIVAFARSIGYPSTLTAEHPATALHFIAPLPATFNYPNHLPWCSAFDDLLRPETHVATLVHEDEISSQGNRYEAQLVAGMVWMLRQSVSASLDGRGSPPAHRPATPEEFWRYCVGIVTPHRAQRALVARELEQLWPGEADFIASAVDTVERFQGGERHTVIVTFGVADVDLIGGEEAFLMQLERTNVAVSRAMAKCIVVMPDSLATYVPEDKKVLSTAFALKDYVEEFCNQRVVTTLSQAGVQRMAEVRYRG